MISTCKAADSAIKRQRSKVYPSLHQDSCLPAETTNVPQFANIYNAGLSPLTGLTVTFRGTLPTESVGLSASLAESTSLAAGSSTQLSLTISAGLVRWRRMCAVGYQRFMA